MEREVGVDLASALLDESLPQQSTSSVIGEGEINGTVEELFEILLTSLERHAGTSNDCDTGFIGDPLSLPFVHGLLDTVRVGHVVLLGLLRSFTLLLFTREYLFALINIDDSRCVGFGSFHDHRHHLLSLSLGGILSKSHNRRKVEDQRFGLGSTSSDHQGLSSAFRSVEQDGPHVGRVSLSYQLRAKREDNVLNHQLAD